MSPSFPPERLTTCCNAPFGVGGERSTHWYLCAACGQPTHELEYEEPTEAEMAELMTLNVDNPVELQRS